MAHEQMSEDDVRAMFERPSWEERYSSPDRVWSGRPNPQLVAEVEALTPGTALDVGCGEGADTIWLAQRGWSVTGLDFSQAGLDRAAAAATDAGVSDRTTWEQGDIRTWRPTATYDLISCHFMHLLDGGMGDVVPRLADALSPGGTLLVVGHHPDDLHAGVRRPSAPGILFTPDHLVPTLDTTRFDVTGEVRQREQVHEGAAVTVQDSVVIARRR